MTPSTTENLASQTPLSLNDLRIALAGLPNCGKTSLFNALTGGRQKVANYPGVTVERKEGAVTLPDGRTLTILDLPGTYSLDARTPDEEISRDVLLGGVVGEPIPQTLVAVADATNLERNLGLVLELKALGRPVVLALNMMDLARDRGLELDLAVLSRELGIPVVATVAVKKQGIAELLQEVARSIGTQSLASTKTSSIAPEWKRPEHADVRARFAEVDRVLKLATRKATRPSIWTDRIDRVVLHPVFGFLLFGAVLAFVFQAIFTWASVPADVIEGGVAALGQWLGGWMSEGALRSLLVDGVIAGVGSVLVFLPQILLLFLFILLLEDSGYMARAAFLMDRAMGGVGLHGRAFIPLLSSFACAIPGIMSARTIGSPRDRLTTILVAPLTTCSARLPVYALLIAAFIPNTDVLGPLKLQGLVMFGLYLAGGIAPLAVAYVFRRSLLKGPKPPLLIELPTYKWPSFKGVGIGLFERAKIFLRRAGTVILSLSILIWFLSSYPKAPIGAAEPAIHYSYAGQIGHAVEPVLKPLGFDWRVGIALIPGFAAREVMVSALGTVYAIEGANEEATQTALGQKLSSSWSLATALSLLVWYIFAPQCLSTLAVVRRETNSWKWTFFMLAYMTALAFLASFVTFQGAKLLGWA